MLTSQPTDTRPTNQPTLILCSQYAEGEGEYELEYEDGQEGEGEEGEDGEWAPSPQRVQHMKSALMIQRAACLDLIGEAAFNEL